MRSVNQRCSWHCVDAQSYFSGPIVLSLKRNADPAVELPPHEAIGLPGYRRILIVGHSRLILLEIEFKKGWAQDRISLEHKPDGKKIATPLRKNCNQLDGANGYRLKGGRFAFCPMAAPSAPLLLSHMAACRTTLHDYRWRNL